jgi:hypothetical protein
MQVQAIDFERLLTELQAMYGATLQNLNRDTKIKFRAILSLFLVNKDIAKSIELVDAELWKKEPNIAGYVTECSKLNSKEIEELIRALTAQLISTLK